MWSCSNTRKSSGRRFNTALGSAVFVALGHLSGAGTCSAVGCAEAVTSARRVLGKTSLPL